jgi:hypothetical protein
MAKVKSDSLRRMFVRALLNSMIVVFPRWSTMVVERMGNDHSWRPRDAMLSAIFLPLRT